MNTLRAKLLWLIAGRAAVITLLLGSAILIRINVPGAFPIETFFVLIGITYALTAAYGAALKYFERYSWLVDVQLGCDAVIVSAIVYITGGVSSYFSSLYTLPIIAASTIQSRRGGMMVGVLSTLLYGGLVLAQYYGAGFFPVVTDYALLPPARVAMFTVGLNIFGFFAVAVLSGHLAENVRRAGEQLVETSNQLADLQAFSQHVIDSLTSGLATTDIDGRVLTFNRAAEAITRVTAAEAVGRSIADVLQFPRDLDGLFGAREGRPKLPRVEVAFTRQDSVDIELGLSTALLLTPRGETGFLFTFQDVTESRKRDREARVQQRLAAVGEMAAGIAHEIRNPLASMSGSIQILRQELPLTAEQSQLMDIVLRESDRLNETIRSFLAYAKPQRLSTERVDVRQIITDTACLLQNNAELTEDHQIDVDVPSEPAWYVADENQIRQVVWNLATNGVRAMPKGGKLRLSLARRNVDASSAGEMVIRVEDQGVGIAPEELDGIFQPFRGAFERGTGLGLAIVHRIVSDYGGEVHVTSERGAGTRVEVTLPLATPAPADARALLN
ncbi:MAG: ATP-binding protein [Acidobacteriota bacterium]|nr:ATP-binding protein [Acidobacteriota bacterium]